MAKIICVLSLVYSPPGTKLYATTQTELSTRMMYIKFAKVKVHAAEQQYSLSIIAGHIDMTYTARITPPSSDQYRGAM